ncbi:MAG: 1-(5-phosphoribosyl)-5-[(5-phosphoribosylamino)methylideneamino]imidazole-4-carboxamide isomerase [Clostridia bacterium]|nr:1-(5-phosphoribosyl)-5-[(5-phosphoribosylamino)methylideneamino]imidazole-4-carboxamide isomerase [Clostridia bacterium]
MLILPAIDLYGGCAVRLKQGDYAQRTVYSDSPWAVAAGFSKAGAMWLHIVDLDGAKEGTTANLGTIERIVNETPMQVEVGGGIRSLATVRAYLSMGVKRVILGTAAVTDPAFLQAALDAYGSAVAVGVDVREGLVSIKGWTEQSGLTLDAFLEKLQSMGVSTVICTDISKDGMMGGSNTALYTRLSKAYSMDLIASGGVSSLADISSLAALGLYGAIVGKALYTGDLDLAAAIAAAKEG